MPESSRFGHLPWLLLSVLILVADRVTKDIFEGTLSMYQRIEVIPGYFDWTLAYNTGAAFSFLADAAGWQRWFFAGIALGICVVLAVLMYRSKATQKLNNIAYALIIGGALGNLFDRLWHGFVVDMIDFYVGNWHFATFNLADTAICIGAALIVLEGFLPKPAAKEQA